MCIWDILKEICHKIFMKNYISTLIAVCFLFACGSDDSCFGLKVDVENKTISGKYAPPGGDEEYNADNYVFDKNISTESTLIWRESLTENTEGYYTRIIHEVNQPDSITLGVPIIWGTSENPTGYSEGPVFVYPCKYN